MITEQYTYFWKPHDKNGFLSNWFYSPFNKNGIQFINSEQYFMWRKQQLFDSENIKLESDILNTTDSRIIKNLGRKVNNFDEKVWNDVKYNIMYEAVYEKFSQNIRLKHLLTYTKNTILVEASPYDRVWGIGINEKNARRSMPWKGDNLLGKALMEVRDNILREF